MRFLVYLFAAACVCGLSFVAPTASAADPLVKLNKGDKIVFVGNTLAERMQYYPHFETLLHSRFPELELVVRNLGWSADELTIKLRSKDFADHGHNLEDHKPDVIFAFFGFNESFQGEAGLEKFKTDLKKYVQETTTKKYNGETPPQLVLFSPIANEDLKRTGLTDCQANNERIAVYTKAMAEIAAEAKVPFVDLYTPSLPILADAATHLTDNGIHLNDAGYQKLAPMMDEALFGPRPTSVKADLAKLKAEIDEKNLQHQYDYRAINGFYIYGGRKAPFGVVNFPAEFAKLRKMIENRDQRIWAVAAGKEVPATIDDSNTGEFTPIETNFKREIYLTPPEESRQKMKLPEGFEVNLFASEVEFPELENPVQMTFDAKGRLWVTTIASYPMYLPGKPVNDRILIFEDTNGDGKADKQTVFAEGLHVPIGIELANGGVYVSQQPNLMFLQDTDGDDKADVRKLVLHGFDSADSHHSISAFTLDPGGALYFQEGTFHQSQIETPYGPTRLSNAGVFRYEPRSEKLDVFVSYGFANPWGHTFDRWGQNFVADASGGANYFGTAFSGDVDYPRKHPGMKQFLKMQWRPTAGCETVSSRNFPANWQGNYLLNNCIGFQGTLNYKVTDEGSGFHGDPLEPLLKSEDPNYRPVDMEFGPDGAFYICDWFNPLVGHMQHSIRDPNRDHIHGRIWRVTYKGNALVQPAKITGEPTEKLLDLLKTYEDRTRYRVKIELSGRKSDEVIAATKKWLAGLDTKDAEYEHHRLEGLWVHQWHNAIDEELLKQVLRSPDYRARAAATRVLCYWRGDVKEPLQLLQVQVNDEHPRVRLEAIRALSFFRGSEATKAIDIVTESLIHPDDDYIKYTFKETMATLESRVKAAK